MQRKKLTTREEQIKARTIALLQKTASHFVEQAKTAMADGDLHAAEDILNRSIKANPRQVSAYLLRAKIHEKNNLIDEAIADLNGAIREDTNPERKIKTSLHL